MGIDDVRIRVERTGICGTDLHIESWDPWAERTIRPPLVVGHEFVGEVLEVGSHVRDLAPGDRVSGEGPSVCGGSRHCRAGRFDRGRGWHAVWNGVHHRPLHGNSNWLVGVYLSGCGWDRQHPRRDDRWLYPGFCRDLHPGLPALHLSRFRGLLPAPGAPDLPPHGHSRAADRAKGVRGDH